MFICHFSSYERPRLVLGLKSKRIRDIACGSAHSAAISSSGELYTWGLGDYGRLGHGDLVTQTKPKMVRCRFVSISNLYFAYKNTILKPC